MERDPLRAPRTAFPGNGRFRLIEDGDYFSEERYEPPVVSGHLDPVHISRESGRTVLCLKGVRNEAEQPERTDRLGSAGRRVSSAVA